MNRHCTVLLLAFLSLFITLPVQAERLACTATYNNSTGALNINAVEVGSKRYVVELTAITGGTTLRFKLNSATMTDNRDCFDAATVSGTTVTIPDIAVADSFYNATLTLVTGNGPTQIDLATSSPSTMQFDLVSSGKNPRLVPDAGIRVEKAGIPFATVNSSTGTTYLGYVSAVDGSENFQSSTDGLTFSNPTLLTLTNRSVDSRITHLPDGKWRLYLIDQNTGIMTSYYSSDGNVFGPTLESGTRYTATADDKISGRTPYTGVYDLYTAASDGAVILVYLGDLMGKNNLRMAKSTDNGVTFTFVKGNVLGDDGTGYAFVDNKTVLLADGRRRMFTMRGGQLQSFVTTDGYAWSREVGTRISYYDFASVGVTLYSLNDPVPVFDKNGNLKVYVAGATGPNASTPGNTNWGLISATWNPNVGSGVLGSNGVCGSSNGTTSSATPTSNLCTTGTASAVTGSGPWSWTCAGSNGGVAATCTTTSSQITYTIGSASTGSGTVTCTSPVNNGGNSVCTVTASTGYQLTTFTDNSIDKMSSVAAGSYSIINVIANHAIVATFTPSTSTTTAATTKAKVYLGTGGDSFTISSNGTTLYGGAGIDTVTIADGISGVILDQNVDRINFTGASSSYAFKQTGNKINVYNATDTTILLVSAPVQGDSDGTILSFSNGTALASATLSAGVMNLGGATVTAAATTLVNASGTSLIATVSSTPSTASATTKAKVFLDAGGDSFTVSSNGTTLYGGAGNDTVTIAAGVTGVTLDQNVDRINFSLASSSYTFKQTGNKINVYNSTGITLLATLPVQGDTDGTVFSFSDGTKSALLTGGVMTLGGATVSSTTVSTAVR